MRGKQAKKRELQKDVIYNDEVVTKFINYVMLDGRKNTARQAVYDAVEDLAQRTKMKPMDAMHKSIDNIKPKMEVRSRRVGGSNYQVPSPVRDDRQLYLALTWIIDSARGRRKGTTFAKALSDELFDAYNLTGNAFKKKEDAHKMADAN
ncbi:30S ribosomal protein S7, partial [Candidatus Dojkabacteria bacterium]|nr:30S ribosomal protein S7 [Candidatus Dojkabacteria bacterium]